MRAKSAGPSEAPTDRQRGGFESADDLVEVADVVEREGVQAEAAARAAP